MFRLKGIEWYLIIKFGWLKITINRRTTEIVRDVKNWKQHIKKPTVICWINNEKSWINITKDTTNYKLSRIAFWILI